MMSDYNVSDHWDNEPTWIMSLVSSLDRRHRSSTVLPLTVAVEEILHWVQLASGEEAWARRNNRGSLRDDLAQSAASLGSSLRSELQQPLRRFDGAFNRLASSAKDTFKTSPGMRDAPVWSDVEQTAGALLASLETDAAVAATWDDLVAVAEDATRADQAYRPIADLLYDQLRRRGLDAERTFREVVEMLAFGTAPDDRPGTRDDVPVDERLARARAIVGTPASVAPTAVWLGYRGRAFPNLTTAGPVTFFDADWAVPNARPDGQRFTHKDELCKLLQRHSLFKVAARLDEASDVDSLARVDLGDSTSAGAAERAVDIVDTIVNFSIHNAGGARPRLAQSAVLHGGQPHAATFLSPLTELPDDRYGARATATAIGEFGPRIAEALARDELPRFLAAALEVQTTADHPFSRDRMLQRPSEADVRAVVPLGDRVVQHVAAHAAMTPNALFTMLGACWPHQRWLNDVRRAVHMCLAPLARDSDQRQLREDLTRVLYTRENPAPFLLLVAERREDLLAVCRVESDRGWVAHMLDSVGDHAAYSALMAGYERERDVLAARRTRTRDALTHGNPASFAVVASVRDFAEFLSGWALHLGMESHLDGVTLPDALCTLSDEAAAMSAGTDAASYWRSRLATDAADAGAAGDAQ